jgi:hypothetical protein
MSRQAADGGDNIYMCSLAVKAIKKQNSGETTVDCPPFFEGAAAITNTTP